jgi:hypothetical protein
MEPRSDLASDTHTKLEAALAEINIKANVRNDGFCIELAMAPYHARMLANWIKENNGGDK